jgi:capsular polysaccharide biosynthesis protein
MSQHILDKYTIYREKPVNYVEGELDFCKNEFSYQTFDVRIIELKNCVVNYRGFAYEQKKLMLNRFSLLDDKPYTKFLNQKHYIKKVLFKKKRNLDREKYLLAFDDWSNSHYHWFCDVLPRLFSIKELIKDYILLVPESEYVKNIGLASLDFFELKPAGIEFIKDTELIKVKDLSIVTHTCATGYTNDKVMQQMQDFIKIKLNHKIAEKKIYVTRDKARYRKVLNEFEVWDVVKSNGYEVVRFEDLSWKEQILKCASVKSMVSIHGAGLVNTMFMPKGGSVLEFRRDKIYHNQCFWHLSTALKLDYYYLFGQPDNDDLVLEGGDCCNLTIDPKKLNQILLQINKTS